MNQTPPADQAGENPEGVAQSSIWARVFNVFAAPGEVYDEVKASPPCTANWLVPALLVILVGWVGCWLVFSQATIMQQIRDMREAPLEKQVESGKLTREQAEQAKAVVDRFGDVTTKIAAFAMPVMLAFASPFWWALLLWLVGAKVMKAEFTYMRAVEVAGLANMIMVLESAVKTLLILIKGSLFAGAHLGMLVKDFDPTNSIHGLLASVDAVALWCLAVKGVGLSRLTGGSLGKSMAWVFGLWIFFTGLSLGFGLLAKRVFGG